MGREGKVEEGSGGSEKDEGVGGVGEGGGWAKG